MQAGPRPPRGWSVDPGHVEQASPAEQASHLEGNGRSSGAVMAGTVTTSGVSCQNAQPPGGAADGTVISTKPPAGALVNKGSDVTILAYPCPS
jgi:hypothetical protein